MIRGRHALGIAGLPLLLMATGALAAPAARLALPAILGEHAAIQSGMPVPVWGWARPGARVLVILAGQERKAIAGKDGRWRTTFASIPAGPVGDLSVTDGKARVVSRDLVAGEVWVCSGQSNMAFGVGQAREGATELKGSDDASIRLFQQEQLCSDTPLADTQGRWRVCSAD